MRFVVSIPKVFSSSSFEQAVSTHAPNKRMATKTMFLYFSDFIVL